MDFKQISREETFEEEIHLDTKPDGETEHRDWELAGECVGHWGLGKTVTNKVRVCKTHLSACHMANH